MNNLVIKKYFFFISSLFIFLQSTEVFALSYESLKFFYEQNGKVLGSNLGVQFSLNSLGLQTLTFNGKNFLSYPASGNGPLVGSAVFRSPSGVEKEYGWKENTLGHDDFYFSYASTTLGSTGDFFIHTYRPGKADSVTVKHVFSVIDPNTLKLDSYITNNDSVDTLAQINLGFLPLQIPGPMTNWNVHDVIYSGMYPADTRPVIFQKGAWGSTAMWLSEFSKPNYLGTYFNSVSQVDFPISFSNYSTNQIGHIYEDLILPGQTKQQTIYLRFGDQNQNEVSLAPEAFSAYRQAFPYLVNWTDRRPIARWFISEGTKRSTLNPRGYFWDDKFDVSNQSNFNTKLFQQTDSIIALMNSMNPKPQAVLIWDLEGQEFSHAFTYVGYPNKLPDLAPEMDAAADQMFAKFKAAGYQVAMTLRPMKFGTGTVLPSTCHNDTNYSLTDKFIKTDAPVLSRAYLCTSENMWSPVSQLGDQVVSDDDQEILNLLRSKISYAKNRWGAKIFYVDSTVYSKGAPVSFEIFRQLQKEFPEVLLLPENESTGFYGSSAPYNQANMGWFNTSSWAKQIYPQAFSAIQAIDGVNYSDLTTYNALVQAVKDGNILFLNGWFNDPQNENILKVYRDAYLGSSPSPVVPTPSPAPTPTPVTPTPTPTPTPAVPTPVTPTPSPSLTPTAPLINVAPPSSTKIVSPVPAIPNTSPVPTVPNVVFKGLGYNYSVVLPKDVYTGAIVKFTNHPAIFYVTPEGLFPFDTLKSYKAYKTASKQPLKIFQADYNLFTRTESPASVAISKYGVVVFTQNSDSKKSYTKSMNGQSSRILVPKPSNLKSILKNSIEKRFK